MMRSTRAAANAAVTAKTVVLAAALFSTCNINFAEGFLPGSPFAATTSSCASTANSRSSSTVRARSWVDHASSASPLPPPWYSATRGGKDTALSMVSLSFGEKINTDRIVSDKTAKEGIEELYPEAVKNNPGFLDEVGHGETRTFSDEELRKRLEVAHVFVKMANLVLLSRGMNILAEDFKYYSPGTGRLDRDRFLRMTKTLDVAFSTFRVFPSDFVVYKDGTVTYRRTFRAVHDGYLQVGEKTYPPSMTKVISDVDLCTVSFDDTGVMKSYTYGLMVELVYAIEDPEAVAEIVAIEKRIVNQKMKMDSLAGQESSIAYSKCKADIDTMGMDIEALNEKVNSAPNTAGLGGIPGLFAAVGAEFPKDLTNLEGSDAYGDIEGMRLASFSFPTEVREYQTFDTDEFKEMK